MSIQRRQLLLSGLFAPLAGRASAEDEAAPDYPRHAVKLIVPWPAGGSVDSIARVLARSLSMRLGQEFIVDNRAGASGNIGAALVAKAAPDGYTLLIATTPMVIGASNPGKHAFDVVKDFAPVSLITTVPNVLVVKPSGPATVKALVAQAKVAPGVLRYASSGQGTQLHLVGESFRRAAGIEIVHVPYKGGPPALGDVIGGRVQMMFPGVPAVLPHLRSGQLKALAVTSRKRLPLLPDVPSMAEAGYPGVEAVDWYGVAAPAGTLPSVVARLNAEIRQIIADAGVRDDLLAKGFLPTTSTPEQFGALMDTDRMKWAAVVKQAGITFD
jgi:tripartite-type tricarboxylate transporter receptor subunit TctC